MKTALFEIIENQPIAHDIFRMRLVGDAHGISAPGQFVNIALEGCFLRRPISVSDYDDHGLTLIYKVVGRGTEKMSTLHVGEMLDVMLPLGNGFTVASHQHPLVVGGGVGIAPLYALTKRLGNATVVLGVRSKEDLFFEREFSALGAKVFIATEDGTLGTKGFVTDAIRENAINFDYFYTCGPMPMMKALAAMMRPTTSGQLSFEERMGCGFGACMGCSLQMLSGSKRVCKDGPVFNMEDVIW